MANGDETFRFNLILYFSETNWISDFGDETVFTRSIRFIDNVDELHPAVREHQNDVPPELIYISDLLIRQGKHNIKFVYYFICSCTAYKRKLVIICIYPTSVVAHPFCIYLSARRKRSSGVNSHQSRTCLSFTCNIVLLSLWYTLKTVEALIFMSSGCLIGSTTI